MTSEIPCKFDYLLKYIIIGGSTVGKSNLLLRYVHQQFNVEHFLTFGLDFKAKNIQIDNKIFRIQIWDTSGPENFRSLIRSYCKKCVCILIVYDISNRETFDIASSWIEDCKKNCLKTIFMILVGNKCDLNDRRQVSTEEGLYLSEKNNMLFYETSAKDGINVEEIFLYSANIYQEKLIKDITILIMRKVELKKAQILYLLKIVLILIII